MGRVRVAVLAIVVGCAVPRAPASGPSPSETVSLPSGPRELLPDDQVQQALNRLAFGPRPGDAEAVRAMGVDRWIDQQLHPERMDDARATSLLASYPAYRQQT